MSWIFLFFAIIFEVCGTTSIKLSQGFKKPLYIVLIFFFYFLSFLFLSFSVKKIDLSIAYAIWSGVGTLFITIICITILKEKGSVLKFISIALIIIGVVGLKLSGNTK